MVQAHMEKQRTRKSSLMTVIKNVSSEFFVIGGHEQTEMSILCLIIWLNDNSDANTDEQSHIIWIDVARMKIVYLLYIKNSHGNHFGCPKTLAVRVLLRLNMVRKMSCGHS